MEDGSLFFSCIAHRSIDTIETLINKQRMYESSEEHTQGVIHPCSNMQKKSSTGLTGIMTDFEDGIILHALDSIADNIFCGISVVRCNVTEVEGKTLGQTESLDALQKSLDTFMDEKQKSMLSKSSIILDQVLPKNETFDFWWLDQSCEFTGGSHVHDCILTDQNEGRVNFYDAFACVHKHNDINDTDTAFKDASCWDPVLRGNIGIYAERNGTTHDIFFICISDFASIASDIVRSIKSDIAKKITIQDFCQSKEMWFLQTISLRNRLRLILEVSEHLGICVPKQYDLHAHENSTNPYMAIEVSGTEINSTTPYQHMNSSNGKIIQGVHFFQSCVDANTHRHSIPITLGDSMGVVLLFPDKFGSESFSNFTEGCRFVHNAVEGKCYLCPVTNISESDTFNVKKIQNENNTLTILSIDDVLYSMNQEQRRLNSTILETMRSKNEYGEPLFYGVRHDLIRSLVVIYPKHVPCFLESSFLNTYKTFGFNNKPAHVQEKKQLDSTVSPFLTSSIRYSTLEETMCGNYCMCEEQCIDTLNVFGFEKNTQNIQQQKKTVSVEWDDLLISSIQKMSMINNHKTDTVKLMPMIFYKNYSH